jgi:hypothetical protein
VIVQTASGAQVSLATSSATLVPQRAVDADRDGRASLAVTAQAAGVKVAVDVRATKAGAVARCATSFTPVDLPQTTDSPGLPPIQVTTQPLPPAGAVT